MQIKELIEQLKELEAKHGNLPVVATNSNLNVEMPYIYVCEEDNDDGQPVERIILIVEYS